MSWKKFFTPVDNAGLPLNVQGQSGDNATMEMSQVNAWLPEIYAGSPNRLFRYAQYDGMDADSEVNIALDTIAEFGTQEDEATGMPFIVEYHEDPSDTETKIISKTLKQWCALNDMYKRSFRIFRSTIKYGDQFFIRDPETYELFWIDPANVEKVIVNETEGKKIETYFIRDLEPIMAEKVATDVSGIHTRPYGAGGGIGGVMGGMQHRGAGGNMGLGQDQDLGTPVDAQHIVHISLTEGMDMNWPFGVSILEPIFKTFKQKELLEDSILIYRVHRAPERRVFIIDVGNMPPHKAKQHLEKIKYEVQQKRIPGKNSQGQNVADSAYNPMSMLEDYFFAQTADGRGSKVETLPGGENLGQIDDLRYFNNKMMRGLRIPSSYLPTGPEDGTATYHDGKVGVAYIQEFRFSTFVERLQRQIEEDIDREFKMFLKYRGIDIDNSTFSIEFTPPMNFSDYREIQLQAERAGLFSQVQGIPFLSNQFKLKKYLGLTEEEIMENEELWRQENEAEGYTGLEAEGTGEPGLGNMGIRPDAEEAVDLDAEPDLGDMEDPMADPMGGGDMAAPQAGGGAAPPPPGGTI
jgi:hypothetical protein